MPKVLQGASGVSGTFTVVPYEIADDLIVSDNRNPQIRVRFHPVGDANTVISLGVDIEDANEAYRALQACCPTLSRSQVVADETQLRIAIGAALTTEPRQAYVRGSYIQNFTAPIGKHKGKFDAIFMLSRPDQFGRTRVGISLRSNEGLQSVFFCPWGADAEGRGAAVLCRPGATPQEDEIELFESKWVWEYLQALGLDWGKFNAWLGSAKALYTSVGLDGEIPGLFADHENITPELTAFMHNQELNGPLPTVRWEVIPGEKEGQAWVKKNADKKVALTFIESDNAAFNMEVGRFHTAWDALTQALSGDDGAYLCRGDKLTGEGKQVAYQVMKPIIDAYPDCVKNRKADGSPSIILPPNSESWHLNGLVAITRVAELLLKEGTLSDIVSEQEQLLAWVNLSVGELQDELVDSEEEAEGDEL